MTDIDSLRADERAARGEPKKIYPSINAWCETCHLANLTWWRDPVTGVAIQRNRGELFMLMVSEIAEAMEGERKSGLNGVKMDDHLPHRPMAEVELADALIRIFDYAGAHGIDMSLIVPEGSLNDISKYCAEESPLKVTNKGEALLRIVGSLCREDIHIAMVQIFRYAGTFGYDIDGAIREKMDYNARRLDHKPEHRAAAGGKKW